MNRYAVEENPSCYFHPKEVIIGICPLCLKERLLTLAPKQPNRSFSILKRRSTILLPRVFALGSFLHRLEIQEPQSQKPNNDRPDFESSIASLDDSFISIKFEDNGHALWDNKRPAASTGEAERSVSEHSKQRGTLRWRTKIGQLLQLARGKRSSKAGTCHVSGLEVVKPKGRRGWIRRLTQRRTTTER